MLSMDTRSTQLDQFGANGFQRPEIELLLTIIAPVSCGGASALQAVSADDLARGNVLDQKVVTNLVESIRIPPGQGRVFQTLLELEIEHRKSQALRCLHV